jgi:hypothetical protein
MELRSGKIIEREIERRVIRPSIKMDVYSKYIPNPRITLYIRDLHTGEIIDKIIVNAFSQIKDIDIFNDYLSVCRTGILKEKNGNLLWEINNDYYTFLSKDLYIYEVFPFVNEKSYKENDYAFIDVSNIYDPEFTKYHYKIKVKDELRDDDQKSEEYGEDYDNKSDEMNEENFENNTNFVEDMGIKEELVNDKEIINPDDTSDEINTEHLPYGKLPEGGLPIGEMPEGIVSDEKIINSDGKPEILSKTVDSQIIEKKYNKYEYLSSSNLRNRKTYGKINEDINKIRKNEDNKIDEDGEDEEEIDDLSNLEMFFILIITLLLMSGLFTLLYKFNIVFFDKAFSKIDL